MPGVTGADEGAYKAISVGWEHTIALKSDGSIWTWGRNNRGQLGDGTGGSDDTNTNRNVPGRAGTDTNWTAISTGNDHTIALKSDGSL